MRTRATRLLAVLPLFAGLFAGLFAMHGVQAANGGSHAMPVVSSASMPYGPAAHAGPDHAMPGHSMGGAPVERAASAMPGHDGVMCLALEVHP